MGDVLQFRQLPKDGGKARIRSRRAELALSMSAKAILAQVDSLTMDHADPEDTRPSDIA